MQEIPEDSEVYGFTYATTFPELDIDEIHDKLEERGVSLDDVCMNILDDESCVWLLASSKFYTDEEIENSIRYLIENDLANDYYIGKELL